jgi:EmrB/QacA subfamily drug resistance transporter
MVTTENRKWWTVAAMAPPLLILTIDFFGIAVALPSIGHDLHTSTSNLEWTVNAFMLAFAAPLIAVGRLGDIIGRRKVLIMGTVIFAISSVICGLADTDWLLITGRAIQGIGTAMTFANSLSIVSNAFPKEERAVGIGIWTSIGTVGSALGPLIGGVLTQYLSWHWFFFVNVPISVVAIALTFYVVEESRDETASRQIDIVGLVTVTTGFVLIVLGIEMIDKYGWSSPLVLGAVAGGIAVLLLFVFVEGRIRNPLVEFGLFENREFLGSSGVAFTENYVFGALTFFMTLYLQHILGFSPVKTGFVFLAYTVPFIAFSPLAGKAMRPWGARMCMLVGMLLLALSFVVFTFISPTTGVLLAIVGFVIHSVGQSFAYNISTAAAMEAVTEQKAGEASGVISTIRMIAVVFGVAVTGVLFKTLEKVKIFDLFAQAGRSLTAAERAEVHGLLSGSADAQAKLAALAPEAAKQVEAIVRKAFIYGLDGAMILCLAVSLLGAVAALQLRRESSS